MFTDMHGGSFKLRDLKDTTLRNLTVKGSNIVDTVLFDFFNIEKVIIEDIDISEISL